MFKSRQVCPAVCALCVGIQGGANTLSSLLLKYTVYSQCVRLWIPLNARLVIEPPNEMLFPEIGIALQSNRFHCMKPRVWESFIIQRFFFLTLCCECKGNLGERANRIVPRSRKCCLEEEYHSSSMPLSDFSLLNTGLASQVWHPASAQQRYGFRNAPSQLSSCVKTTAPQYSHHYILYSPCNFESC